MTRQPNFLAEHRRALAVFAALIALVVVGVLVPLGARSDDEPASPVTTTTTGSVTTADTAPPDPVDVDLLLADPLAERPPTTYRIVYDIVENELARTETWTVRRPYESLIVSERDGEQVSGTATSVDALWTFLADRDGWLPVQAERHRAAFDLRPAPAIGPMLALGLVEAGPVGEYAGTACRTFVTGQPPTAAEVTAPSVAESTALCIDDRGLVLHERWQLDGTTVVERTARSIDVDIEVDAAMFDPTPVIDDADDFTAAFSAIAVEADAETLDRLRTEVPVPEGHVYDGAVLRAATPGSAGAGAAEIIRYYSDGPDLTEVAEIITDGPVDLGGDPAVPVEVAGWDEVWFVPDFRASSLQARLTESTYVELRGPDPALLFTMLRSLERIDG